VSLDLAALASFGAAFAAPLLGESVILSIFQVLVMTLFVIAALMLMLVILVQEGKGGGIAGAFGGAVGETFGVKAGSINRFTAILATVFVGLALIYAGISTNVQASVIAPADRAPTLPSVPANDGPPPAMDAPPPAMGETPPAMDGTTPPPGTPPATPEPAMDGTTPPPGTPPATPEPAMDGATPPAPAPEPVPPEAPMDGSTPPAPTEPAPAPAMNG